MKYFNKKRFTMRQVVGLLTIVFLGITVIAYAAVNIPNVFSSGTTISSSQVNANFTALGNAMPAVKTAYSAGCINVTTTAGTYQDILTLGVTPTVNGYIILSGTGYGGINQAAAEYNYAWVSLSTSTAVGGTVTAFGINTTGLSAIPRALDSLYISNVFPVTGGTAYTFRIIASRDAGGGTVQVCSPNLTAVFVPSLL